jgi:DNA-binding protein HU-beta
MANRVRPIRKGPREHPRLGMGPAESSCGYSFSTEPRRIVPHHRAENPCTRLTSVIPSAPVNFIASRGMSGNGPTTVMLKGLVEQLAEGHQLPKKLAQDLLSGMIDSVTRHLKQCDRIRISGLGTLEVRKREARTGRNPATGEMIQIAASKKVAFRPAKELKEAV